MPPKSYCNHLTVETEKGDWIGGGDGCNRSCSVVMGLRERGRWGGDGGGSGRDVGNSQAERTSADKNRR